MPPGVSAVPVLDRCIEEAEPRARAGATIPHRANGAASASPAASRTSAIRSAFPNRPTATVELVVLDGVRGARVRVGAADVGQGAHLIMRQIVAEDALAPLDAVDDHRRGLVRSAERRFGLGIAHDADGRPRGQGRGRGWRCAISHRRHAVGDRAVRAAADDAVRRRTGKARRTIATATSRKRSKSKSTSRPAKCACSTCQRQRRGPRDQPAAGRGADRRLHRASDRLRADRRFPHQERPHPDAALQQLSVADRARRAGDDPPSSWRRPIRNGPFGARGMSEMPLVPFAAAVAARSTMPPAPGLSDLPFTPERVLAAITAKRASPNRSRPLTSARA
jgi:CO/xanthine dehydrogenase Mo-binding subunit